MNIYKISPAVIASTCSPRHIQSVIEDLVLLLKKQEALAKEVLTLNPLCNEIGAGKMQHLIALANEATLIDPN